MKKILSISMAIIAFVAITFVSCSDDDPITVTAHIPVAGFTIVQDIVDDTKITLTNTSTYGISYHWSFGDGATSTEAHPTHTYTRQKEDVEYLIELVVKGGTTAVSTTSKKIIVIGEGGGEVPGDKPTKNFTIDIDGNFADWETVPVANLVVVALDETLDPKIKDIKTMKLCANGEYLYMYLELDMTAAHSLDFFIDLDGDDSKGYTNSNWLGMASYFMLRGSIPDAGSNMSMTMRRHKFEGGGQGWSWDTSITTNFNGSKLVAVDGKENVKAFEGRILLSNFDLPDKGLNLGKKLMVVSSLDNADWTEIGGLPTVPSEAEKLHPLTVPVP